MSFTYSRHGGTEIRNDSPTPVPFSGRSLECNLNGDQDETHCFDSTNIVRRRRGCPGRAIRLRPIRKLQRLQNVPVGDHKRIEVGNQILDQDIKSAVDEQLAGKRLRRVESGGDLYVGYQAAVSQEKQFDSLGWGGPGWWVGWGGGGNGRVTTSTIDIGKLMIGLFDPATKQLVWRGSAAKTLDIKKDPDKN